MAKIVFSSEAVLIYGAVQLAEDISAVVVNPTGTITSTIGSTTVTGSGTLFTTELTTGVYLINNSGHEVGYIVSIESDTSLTILNPVPAVAVAASQGVTPKLSAVSGIAFQTALGALNAIAAIKPEGNVDYQTDEFKYSGDSLSRDVALVNKDILATVGFESFLPALGAIAGASPTVAELPMLPWFMGVGLAPVISTGAVTFTNALTVNAFLTIQIRLSSPDFPLNEKVYTFYNCRGSIDGDIMPGTRTNLKFNYQGSLQSILDKPAIYPNYANQKTNLVPVAKADLVTTAQLSVYSGSSAPALVPGTKNICVQSIKMPNAVGFTFTRHLDFCSETYIKKAETNAVNLVILEDKAAAAYNPNTHVTERHSFYFAYGSVTGFKALISLDSLTLSSIAVTDVDTSRSQDLTFKNTGTISIKLS